MTNKLTFSSPEASEKFNKQLVEGMGSNLYIQKYGITGGDMRPEELLELRKKIIAARLATARWLNDAMIAEGIDPSKNTKYNKEKIKFLKDVLKERWNTQTKAGKFGNRPSEVQELNRFLRRKRTFPEQLLRFFPGGAKGTGKQTQLLISSFSGSDANAFLNETETLLTGIDKVGKTRYSSNVDSKWAQKNLGATLFQLRKGGTNPYYNKSLDTYTTQQHTKEALNAKNKYFKQTPMLAEINPLGYLYNLSQDNPSYAGVVTSTGEAKSPISLSKQGKYFGEQDAGLTPWTDRSVRGPGQADADTKAYLLSIGARERDLKYIDSSAMSRLRISGASRGGEGHDFIEFGDSPRNRTRLKLYDA